jgi:hypothetical protein
MKNWRKGIPNSIAWHDIYKEFYLLSEQGQLDLLKDPRRALFRTRRYFENGRECNGKGKTKTSRRYIILEMEKYFLNKKKPVIL